MSQANELRIKLHDLANMLEGIALARHFVERTEQTIPYLDEIDVASKQARELILAFNRELQPVNPSPASNPK